MKVVDVYKFGIPVARRKELLQITGSDQFRSQHQACAVELSSQRKSDLLVALGAKGGASLLFALCAVNREEEKLTTVVIVPSALRLNSLRLRLNKARINVREWKVVAQKNLTVPLVLLVFAETAATREFREFFLARCREKAIARLVFDHIESFLNPPLLTFVTAFNFREKLPDGLVVPFIGTSTTLPLDVVAKIMRQMPFRRGDTQLVWDPSLFYNNISYSVFPLITPANCSVDKAHFSPAEGQLLSVITHVRHALDKFQAQDRALIFCSSLRVAEDFAAALPCSSYSVEASEEVRSSVMKSWKEGDVKALVTTSCLGVDFDYDYIKLVIHYEPRNIFTFLRLSGKAGRSLRPPYVTTFWHVGKTPASNTDDLGVEEMTAYLRTDACRRISLLPGVNTCTQDGTAALCDNCQSQLAHAPIVSL